MLGKARRGRGAYLVPPPWAGQPVLLQKALVRRHAADGPQLLQLLLVGVGKGGVKEARHARASDPLQLPAPRACHDRTRRRRRRWSRGWTRCCSWLATLHTWSRRAATTATGVGRARREREGGVEGTGDLHQREDCSRRGVTRQAGQASERPGPPRAWTIRWAAVCVDVLACRYGCGCGCLAVCVRTVLVRRMSKLLDLGGVSRVGQNHTYTVYIRCIWQRNYQIYNHTYTVYIYGSGQPQVYYKQHRDGQCHILLRYFFDRHFQALATRFQPFHVPVSLNSHEQDKTEELDVLYHLLSSW